VLEHRELEGAADLPDRHEGEDASEALPDGPAAQEPAETSRRTGHVTGRDDSGAHRA
jgi:hypothetical protein